MSRKYRLSTALDIDDLLMECTSYAIKLANEKYKFDPPMTIYEKNSWGKNGTRADAIYQYFNDAEFYRTQPVYKGAKEFVQKLLSSNLQTFDFGKYALLRPVLLMKMVGAGVDNNAL